MKSLLTLLILALSLVASPAQKKETEYVKLGKIDVKGTAAAGSRVTAKLHFTVEPGFHTQSHKPSEENFIPTVLKFDAVAGVKVGDIKYPAGKEEKVEGLEKPLSVYDTAFVIDVPLALSAQAKLPTTLTGTLTYQACRGAVCFPPQKLKVEVKVGP